MADETTDLENEVSNNALYAEVQRLRTEVTRLTNLISNHVHSYAKARTPGGGAVALDAPEDAVSELALVGLSTLDGALGVDPEVVVEGDVVRAGTFVGNLEGTATAAGRLAQSFTMAFKGDVDGQVDVNGAATAEADLRLAPSGVLSGEYGPIASSSLTIGGTFTVPQLVIDDAGRVTWAANKSISIPANIAVAGTTNSLQFDKGDDPDEKLYLVGANIQGVGVRTFSDRGVFINQGRLHTNDHPVVDTESAQAIVNKTYEGYTLGDACARGVDGSVQGTLGSGDLVTSNALAGHVHSYAAAAEPAGAAKAVEVTVEAAPTGVLPVDTGSGVLGATEQVRLEDGALVASTVTVEAELNIPGGSLWIDTQAQVVDVSEYNSGSRDTTADRVYTLQYDDQGLAYTVEEVLQREGAQIAMLERNVASLDQVCTAARADVDTALGTVHSYGDEIAALKLVDEDVYTKLTDHDQRLSSFAAAVGGLDVAVSDCLTRVGILEGLSGRVGSLELRMDAAEALTRFINQLRGDVASATASINGFNSTLATLRTTVANHALTVAEFPDLKNRVSSLEVLASRADVVSFSLGRGGTYVRDLRPVFGKGVSAATRSVTVLVLDEVATSRTKDMFVDASAVTSIGRADSSVTVFNETGDQLQCMLIVR